MNLKDYHFWNHASKGMGETPEECPICMKKIEELEKKLTIHQGQTPYKTIAVTVTASVLAAFIVERLVKRGR